MKSLTQVTLLALFLLSLGARAGETPLCSSSEVRLSLKPVFCIGDDTPGGLLDLPEVGLNLEDIQSIFDGAESSGGHGVVSPMSRPSTQRIRPLPLDGEIKCAASLITDGGKRVSFVSYNSFSFPASKPGYFIMPMTWKHGLEDQFNNWVPVNAAPSVGVSDYIVNLRMAGTDIILSACVGRGNVASCSETSMGAIEPNGSITMVKYSEKPFVKRVFELNCQIH